MTSRCYEEALAAYERGYSPQSTRMPMLTTSKGIGFLRVWGADGRKQWQPMNRLSVINLEDARAHYNKGVMRFLEPRAL